MPAGPKELRAMLSTKRRADFGVHRPQCPLNPFTASLTEHVQPVNALANW
jgi:hypothetical protein